MQHLETQKHRSSLVVVVAHVCNARTQEVEAGGSRIGGQIWLYNETMSQNGGGGRDQKGKGGREQTHRLHHLQNQELRIDGV